MSAASLVVIDEPKIVCQAFQSFPRACRRESGASVKHENRFSFSGGEIIKENIFGHFEIIRIHAFLGGRAEGGTEPFFGPHLSGLIQGPIGGDGFT
jgi:hypothetical protein